MRFVRAMILVVVIAAGVAGAVYVLAGAFYALASDQGPADQPIAFNHALHLDQAGLECLECHTDAGNSVMAGLPGRDICFDCHDVDEIEEQVEASEADPELTKLVPFADSEQDIPWMRVAVTKPDVFFSHRRHVTGGGIECLRCHPDQATLTAPPPVVHLVMTMDDCLACHQENGVSTDCLACHR